MGGSININIKLKNISKKRINLPLHIQSKKKNKNQIELGLLFDIRINNNYLAKIQPNFDIKKIEAGKDKSLSLKNGEEKTFSCQLTLIEEEVSSDAGKYIRGLYECEGAFTYYNLGRANIEDHHKIRLILKNKNKDYWTGELKTNWVDLKLSTSKIDKK